MNLRTLLNERKMSMYRLAQISGIPKTTVIDICSGKSSIECCNAKTVYQLARALECTMEYLMQLDQAGYDRISGLPINETYLEKGLPQYLESSLAAMKKSWQIEDSGRHDPYWDCYWCELNADINAAETERSISREQAGYLRRIYLRMEENE